MDAMRLKQIFHFIKGILIGIAAVIPGLSGSIFAVVVGLYEDILLAVNNLRKQTKKSILFLLPIVIGAAVGVLISTNLVLYICETYTHQSYIFFIGLVLGSIPLILRKMKKVPFRSVYLILPLITFAVILFVSFYTKNLSSGSAESYVAIPQITGIGDFLVIFFSGLVSCSLMSIPGISGSITLMVIGQYGSVYNAVGKCADMLTSLVQGNWEGVKASGSSVFVVLPFALGAIAGFLLIAKFLVYLLKKAEALTYYAVFGLVLGAIATLFLDGVFADKTQLSGMDSKMLVFTVILDLILIAGGIFCSVFLDKPQKNRAELENS